MANGAASTKLQAHESNEMRHTHVTHIRTKNTQIGNEKVDTTLI